MSNKNLKESNKSKQDSNIMSGVTDDNNIDRIRDILFGAKTDEIEKRFTRMEEHFSTETAKLKNDFEKRIDSLEKYLKNEIDSLNNKAKSDKETTNDLINKQTKDLDTVTKSMDKKIEKLDERLTLKQKNLNDQLLEQSKSLTNDINDKYDEIKKVFDLGLQELRNDKTDRVALANLFKEISLRLTDDFKINGSS